MYEATQQQLTTTFSAGNSAVFTDDTIDLILRLSQGSSGTMSDTVNVTQVTVTSSSQVTVPSGTEIVFVDVSSSNTTITPPDNTPVLIFQGKGGVNVLFNDKSLEADTRVVIGADGGNKITINDGVDSKVVAGTGNDSIVSSSGQDTIVAGRGNDTVNAGSGFDQVVLSAKSTDLNVTVKDGHLLIENTTTKTTVDLQNVQYVQLDSGNAVIGAHDNTQAAVSVLYETLFGRTADASGLEHWFNDASQGADIHAIAENFIRAGGADLSALTDAQFIARLYQNTFNRAGEQAGIDYWTNALQSGASRADIATSFAAISVDNFDNNTVDTVGYVKIITDIL